jgi:hypothetical protein
MKVAIEFEEQPPRLAGENAGAHAYGTKSPIITKFNLQYNTEV